MTLISFLIKILNNDGLQKQTKVLKKKNNESYNFYLLDVEH